MTRARPTLMAAIAMMLGATASAWSGPDPEEPRDFDADAEQQSDFWERALTPHRERYDEMVVRAVEELLRQKDRESRNQGTGVLRDAVRLNPDRPLAHLWLARAAALDGDHAACARSLGQALTLEPDFVPPSATDFPYGGSAWSAAYELSGCLARAGDYEAAIDTLRRALGQGHTDQWVIHQRLGESLMGLGRLDEAIESFNQALRLNAYLPELTFSLAVALDRDDQGARARELIAGVIERDPRAPTSLANKAWIPASDGHYTLGLVYLHAGDDPRALYHLRRYLTQAGESPWAKRARAHLEVAQAGAVAGSDLEVKGSATLDAAKASAAIARSDGSFQACLGSTPDLLLTVSLTRVLPDAVDRRRTGSVPTGVRVLFKEQGAIKSDVLKSAVGCVETAASAISLPRPDGNPGAYATAEFSVIRR